VWSEIEFKGQNCSKYVCPGSNFTINGWTLKYIVTCSTNYDIDAIESPAEEPHS